MIRSMEDFCFYILFELTQTMGVLKYVISDQRLQKILWDHLLTTK